jgi:polyribonucleotide nucleotidyltransferase
MNDQKLSLKLGDKEFQIIFNDLAGQAAGSCFVTLGETTVLATVAMSKNLRPDLDFFPLVVDLQEKFYAGGKIQGSRFMRREGRPSDEAILTSRLIDRTIRPLFPSDFKNETQVILTCLSWDGENDHDIVGALATSLALSVSEVPWNGPFASVRIAEKDGKFILNPTYAEREESPFELLLMAIKDKSGELILNMIEAEGKEIQESKLEEASAFAKEYLIQSIDFQEDFQDKNGKEKYVYPGFVKNEEIETELEKISGDRLEKAFYSSPEELSEVKKEISETVKEKYPESGNYVNDFFERTLEKVLEKNVLENEKRPDGRKLDQIREVSFETGFLPRVHGTGVFRRGQTKALSVLTLGSPGDAKLVEGMEVSGKIRFMHHYNFPPFSVGDARPLRGPGRRELGHGALAEKAVAPLLPSTEDFPYTIRVVTEIMSSNGSSSQASVTGACLALMDGGVPIKAPAAGIAVGIVKKNNNEYKLLTDIQGPEDHYGGMDFKVAGTETGITAIQMDVKIDGLTLKMFSEAMQAAKKARLEILDQMKKVITEPKKELSPYAPKIAVVKINPEKIGMVIGSGGKTINKFIEDYDVQIDIDEDGTVFVTGTDQNNVDKVLETIKGMTEDAETGKIYTGTVIKIMDFGAFVEFLPGQEGLVHISELQDKRTEKVSDVIKEGQTIPVKVLSIGDDGKVSLSLKQAK